eukprot:CAMPEP_0169169640 /NCGR_PEP_ID=MMETSP1015-20121227/61679_1 /TAXON_ID=342587 /ORGANISM="Karlodinium micrum, Strain CCMP2283" /LENGTH=65 /DNA_ID=CAMNT_0009242563 /DNA_START=431 /DNA_END=625 /DNA_ORIENTATION=+
MVLENELQICQTLSISSRGDGELQKAKAPYAVGVGVCFLQLSRQLDSRDSINKSDKRHARRSLPQ